MAKLNFVLILAVLVSALAVVSTNHRARRLISEFERQQERMRALEVEWGQLQLEQSTWAAHARIAQIARDKLGMHAPRPQQIVNIRE
ncbi:MAG: cell division protein FtsL [Pseudomonadota bacterium]|uniref:cell division protein FtsL n=1 Tax=Sulfuricystis thermophila TaxID=2496847 RepID=UPI0010366A86|nr:cell division protein FtsL [Sulfuricystis thermophila]MDI6748825.1 cell division protein FtsL [Rhodocyclaceae bacterium]